MTSGPFASSSSSRKKVKSVLRVGASIFRWLAPTDA